MPKLKRVSKTFHLLLPDFVGGPDRAWLRPGSVIDISDPFVAYAVSGQMHKLEDVEDESVAPTPYSIKMLDNARAAWLKVHAPELAPAERPAPKPKGAAGIPRPDARPTKPAAA